MTATETYYIRRIQELEAERDAAYQRGREEAAQAVSNTRGLKFNDGVLTPFGETLLAAARGDGAK